MLKSTPAKGKKGLRRLAAAIESARGCVELTDPAFLPPLIDCLKQVEAHFFHRPYPQKLLSESGHHIPLTGLTCPRRRPVPRWRNQHRATLLLGYKLNTEPEPRSTDMARRGFDKFKAGCG